MAPRSNWAVAIDIVLARIDSMDPGGASADAAELVRIASAAQSIGQRLWIRFGSGEDVLEGRGAVAADAAGVALSQRLAMAARPLEGAARNLTGAAADLSATTATRSQVIAVHALHSRSAGQYLRGNQLIAAVMNRVYSDPMAGHADLSAAVTPMGADGRDASERVGVAGPPPTAPPGAPLLVPAAAGPGAPAHPPGESGPVAMLRAAGRESSSPTDPARTNREPGGPGPAAPAPAGPVGPAAPAPSPAGTAPAPKGPGAPPAGGSTARAAPLPLGGAPVGGPQARPPAPLVPPGPRVPGVLSPMPGAAGTHTGQVGPRLPAGAASPTTHSPPPSVRSSPGVPPPGARAAPSVPPAAGVRGARHDEERRRPDYLLSTQSAVDLIGPLPMAGPAVVGEAGGLAVSDVGEPDMDRFGPTSGDDDDQDLDLTL